MCVCVCCTERYLFLFLRWRITGKDRTYSLDHLRIIVCDSVDRFFFRRKRYYHRYWLWKTGTQVWKNILSTLESPGAREREETTRHRRLKLGIWLGDSATQFLDFRWRSLSVVAYHTRHRVSLSGISQLYSITRPRFWGVTKTPSPRHTFRALPSTSSKYTERILWFFSFIILYKLFSIFYYVSGNAKIDYQSRACLRTKHLKIYLRDIKFICKYKCPANRFSNIFYRWILPGTVNFLIMHFNYTCQSSWNINSTYETREKERPGGQLLRNDNSLSFYSNFYYEIPSMYAYI